MTYSSGNTILATDYNTFVGTVNTVCGASASYASGTGYGESDLATVSASATITAASWGLLIDAVEKAATHQGTTIVVPATNPAVGSTIEALDGTTPITGGSHDLAAAVTAIQTNKDNVDTDEQTTVAASTSNSRSSTWGYGDAAISATIQYQFTDRTHAEAFFNTGGEIHITMQHPNGATAQDNDWRDIFNNKIGTLKLGKTSTSRTGSSGTTPVFGYTGLTSSNQQIFTGYNIGSGVYAANDVLIAARIDTTNHRIQITVVLYDQHEAISPSTADNVALGTAVSSGFRKSTQYAPANPTISVTETFD